MISIPVDPNAHRAIDVLAWSVAIASGWAVSRWRLAEARAKFPRRSGYIISLGIGAVVGAYIAGTTPALMSGQGSLSHSVVGALAGAIIGVELYKMLRGIRESTGGIFVTPFLVGIIIGRWGCLLSGLVDGTYGTPTTLIWGVDLGDGVARHPVQLYESLAMLGFFAVYIEALAKNRQWALQFAFHAMVIFYGAQRFLWEFLKPYPTLIGPFNVFHLISLGLIAYGCVWIIHSRSQSA